MKAGDSAPPSSVFFRSVLQKRDRASEAETVRQQPVKLWPSGAWGFESLLMHPRKVGHGHAEQSRKLSGRKLLRVRLPHLPPSLGGAAQKVVQRRAKPPGARAPVRSSRTASALQFEPVAQMDSERRLAEPEAARSSRAGFASFRGRLKGGRLSLEQAVGVRVLPPEFLTGVFDRSS